jgi:hypothetical protein
VHFFYFTIVNSLQLGVDYFFKKNNIVQTQTHLHIKAHTSYPYKYLWKTEPREVIKLTTYVLLLTKHAIYYKNKNVKA